MKDLHTYDALIEARADVGTAQRRLLERLAVGYDEQVHRCDYSDDMAEWAAATLGISRYRAERWIAAGRALRHLPRTAEALCEGSLSLDKVVELSRFATVGEELKLVGWAKRVSVRAIKERADELERAVDEDVARIEDRMALRHRWLENGNLWVETFLDPSQGKSFLQALRAECERLPAYTKEDLFPGRADQVEDWMVTEARLADALMSLVASAASDEARGTVSEVVLHVPPAAVNGDDAGSRGSAFEGGPSISPALAREIACDSRLRVVLTGEDGNALGIGRASRNVPLWLESQVRYRDGHRCTFPGCDRATHLYSHHLSWWRWGGPTDLDNLITVCSIHHRAIHRWGWRVTLGKDGTPYWFKPDGVLFDPSAVPKTRTGRFATTSR